ncbi:MAG: hypothetical protein E6Q40_07005 [Cupriavidus sp.]|nr:MAG: hypothetical protein E6Q40_07005 [Cupriavidus sp.]
MTREELEHIIRASADVTDQYEFMIQGVGPETAVLPDGWMTRVHRVQNEATNGRVGYCLDVADLFMSKAAASRDKDRMFCMALLEHRYVTPAQVLDLVAAMPLDADEQRRLRGTIRRWARALNEAGHGLADA